MCSWCWGYQPAWQRLKSELPDEVELVYVLGGLAPDTDQAMPAEMQQRLQRTWQAIEQKLGANFNHDFWQLCHPRRSTYPACRAVIAAKEQGKEFAMIEAIQVAYYQRAMNPSDDEVLVQLAEELGLDRERFTADLNSTQTEQGLQEQIAQARSWPISGFPSLVLQKERRQYPVTLDYRDEAVSLAHIHQLMNE